MAIIDKSDVDAELIPGTKILLDGVDISCDCYRAEIYDNGTGAAHCYLKKNGHLYFADFYRIATEIRYGKVEIIRP